jgi:hypothetical protein
MKLEVRMRLLRIVAVSCVVCFLGCGAETPKNVKVSIDPPSISTPVNSVVALKGNGSGFTDTPLTMWWVEETTRDTFYCGTDYDEHPPDSGSCPCGYVAFNKSDTGLPSTAYYHAPSVAGTCHINFTASQWNNYQLQAMQSASAEFTITP